MKKAILLLVLAASMLLSACSFSEEVTHSLEYLTAVDEHIDAVSKFAEDAPQLIKDAATNPEVTKELEEQLHSLKDSVLNFNNIEPPAIAEEIHQQLMAKNEALLEQINTILENGHLILDSIENSQLFNTINDINDLLQRIGDLGL